jgi:hypothetical protein
VTDIGEDSAYQDHVRAGRLYRKTTEKLSLNPPLFDLPPDPIPHPDGGRIPDWIAAQIHASNGPAYRTTATWCRCPNCQEIILTGLDAHILAAAAQTDPTPLNPVQELLCALNHRATYRIHQTGTTFRIQARDKYQPPAGTPGKPPIVPAHVCYHRHPGFLTPPHTERTHHATPPF